MAPSLIAASEVIGSCPSGVGKSIWFSAAIRSRSVHGVAQRMAGPSSAASANRDAMVMRPPRLHSRGAPRRGASPRYLRGEAATSLLPRNIHLQQDARKEPDAPESDSDVSASSTESTLWTRSANREDTLRTLFLKMSDKVPVD